MQLKATAMGMDYEGGIGNYRIRGSFPTKDDRSIFFEFSTTEIGEWTPQYYRGSFQNGDKICSVDHFFYREDNKHEVDIPGRRGERFLAVKDNVLRLINKYSKEKYTELVVE